MEIERKQVYALQVAIEEMKRVARLEGVDDLLIVATKHQPESRSHRFVSVSSIEGCEEHVMKALGKHIGIEMEEMIIADHVHAIQTAYAERAVLMPSIHQEAEVSGMVL